RTATAVLLADSSLLADLGLCRLARHAPGLAGNSGDRRLLCRPAILDLELHQSMDRRYRRVADLHGVPRAVSAGLVADGELDVAGVAPPRRLGRGGACAEIRRSQADAGASVDVASPLDHRVRRPL